MTSADQSKDETHSPSDWVAELAEFLNNAAAAHGFQVMGIKLAREQMATLAARQKPDPANPDSVIHMGVGDPNLPDSEPYAAWRISELPEQLADDGPVMRQIGHEWVVHVYTAWEHHFRPGLASALGLGDEGLRFPLLGDLRRLRNDIVHHRGVATSENTGRSELLGHWFAPGQVILIRGQEVSEFMRRFPWQDFGNLLAAASRGEH